MMHPAAREREKAQKLAQKASAMQNKTPVKKAAVPAAKKGSSTPAKAIASANQRDLDMAGLNLNTKEEERPEEVPRVALARKELLQEVKKFIEARGANAKQAISLVVIGNVAEPVPTSVADSCRRTRRCGQVHLDGTVVVRSGPGRRKEKDCQ